MAIPAVTVANASDAAMHVELSLTESGAIAVASGPCTVVDPQPDGVLRCAAFSDTHGKASVVPLPPADVLIHAGDFSMTGLVDEVQGFADWLAAAPYELKIVIAGNHDITFDLNTDDQGEPYYDRSWQRWHRIHGKQDAAAARELLMGDTAQAAGIVYLEDETIILRCVAPDAEPDSGGRRFVVERVEDPAGLTAEDVAGGVVITGSPWTPEFYDWAFNESRGPHMMKRWKSIIPPVMDVLITHGPPAGHGDVTVTGVKTGCEDLLAVMSTRCKDPPKAHVFGHVHEGYGFTTMKDPTHPLSATTFINASNCTLKYKATNPPVLFDVPFRP